MNSTQMNHISHDNDVSKKINAENCIKLKAIDDQTVKNIFSNMSGSSSIQNHGVINCSSLLSTSCPNKNNKRVQVSTSADSETVDASTYKKKRHEDSDTNVSTSTSSNANLTNIEGLDSNANLNDESMMRNRETDSTLYSPSKIVDLIAAARKAPTGVVTTPIKRIAALAALSKGDVGPILGVDAGARVEVRWFIDDDQEENKNSTERNNNEEDVRNNECEDTEEAEDNSREVWWPGSVLENSGRSHKLEDLGEDDEECSPQLVPIYQIMYDSLPPKFPETSTKDVCILGAHELFDIETGSIINWRFEADTWESNSDNGESDHTNAAIEQVFDSLSEADLASIRSLLLRSNAEVETINLEEYECCPVEKIPKMAVKMVESILESVLSEHGETLKKLPASVQFRIGDDVIALKRAMIRKVTSTWKKKKKFGPEEAREIVEYLSEEVQRVRAAREL